MRNLNDQPIIPDEIPTRIVNGYRVLVVYPNRTAEFKFATHAAALRKAQELNAKHGICACVVGD